MITTTGSSINGGCSTKSGDAETGVTVSKAAATLHLIFKDIVIQANNSGKRDEEVMRVFCRNCNRIIFIILY